MEFCKEWECDLRDLSNFESEEGFIETAGKYMGYWFGQRHAVMGAILANALNEKHPKQREWAEWYLEMTTPREGVIHPAAKLRAAVEAPPDPTGDDDQAIDLAP